MTYLASDGHPASSETRRDLLPRARIAVVLAVVVTLLAGASPRSSSSARSRSKPRPQPLPELNQKVLDFAKAHRGKKVGDGICTTLAIHALRAADAQSYPRHRGNGDFAWGERVERLEDALPGDILQFRDAVFQGKKYVTSRRWISWYANYPHHTAILSASSENGQVLTILHQNVGPKRSSDEQKQRVKQDTLRMNSLQEGGWVRIFRPKPSTEQPFEGFSEPTLPESP